MRTGLGRASGRAPRSRSRARSSRGPRDGRGRGRVEPERTAPRLEPVDALELVAQRTLRRSRSSSQLPVRERLRGREAYLAMLVLGLRASARGDLVPQARVRLLELPPPRDGFDRVGAARAEEEEGFGSAVKRAAGDGPGLPARCGRAATDSRSNSSCQSRPEGVVRGAAEGGLGPRRRMRERARSPGRRRRSRRRPAVSTPASARRRHRRRSPRRRSPSATAGAPRSLALAAAVGRPEDDHQRRPPSATTGAVAIGRPSSRARSRAARRTGSRGDRPADARRAFPSLDVEDGTPPARRRVRVARGLLRGSRTPVDSVDPRGCSPPARTA
jgi:hypothetical protein